MRRLGGYRWIILILVLVTVVGLGWRGRSRGQAQVEEVKVERRDLEEVLIASGEVKAQREATLNFPISAKLAYVRVKEGDSVKKGQSLMGIEAGALDQVVDTAYNNYLAADANAKEVEDSVKGHDKDETFAQKNDRVAAQAARDKAYTVWQQALRDRKRADLVAPFDGVVTDMTVNVVGDTVGVTDGITLVDPRSLVFEFELDEGDVTKMTVGDSLKITLDAFEERELEGRVESIAFVPSVASTGATVYLARASISDMENLRVGMGGDVSLILSRKQNVVSVPFEVVIDGKVKVKEGEKVVERQVKTGLETDEYIEITEGLDENEVVLREK